MRLSIKYKLFFVILSAHFLVYLAMYSVGYYSFQRGFLDYISRIEERQVPALVRGLEDYYERTGSWDPLTQSRGKFGDLLRDSIESSTDPQLIAARQNQRPTPIAFSPNDWYYTSEYSPARPYLHLLDADEKILLGEVDAFSPLATLHPISVRDTIVGYLGVTSRQELSEQADLLFAEQQQNSFFMLALGMVFVSALVAFPVATYLTRPLMQLVRGTRALANGDYDSRIPARGSDELSQLSADFNALAQTLEQNRTARQQWIADISHELRTPLAILQGELESIQDGIRPMNQDTVESLHNEIVHLTTLVNDLHELSLSDLGALVYKKQIINVSEILEQAVDMHQQMAAKHQLRLKLTIQSPHPDNEITMLGDPSRLQQLFDNLLSNACRYTDPGGEIQVFMKEQNGNLVLEHFDSAPGVSENDLAHIFERLYRVETSRNRAKGGSGLGLTICRNIVEAHEGTIVADHSPLGGLKLTITLPLHLARSS
jgi:two-component system sensor histidine kinase BaeS